MRVLLIDEDDDFRNRFGAYLAEHLNGIVLISAADPDQSGDGSREIENADIILTGQDNQIIERLKEAGFAEKTVIFIPAEGSGSFVRSDGIRSVNKYQRASSIISSIAELADAAVTVPVFQSKGTMEIIGVTGFYGGCGCTSFSLMYGRLLCRQKKKSAVILPVAQRGNLNDYFLQAGVKSDLNLLLLNFTSGFRIHPQRFIAEDEYGVGAFVMPEHAACDINELSSEEVNRLLAVIAEWGSFDTLILDISSQMDPVCRFFLRAAERVFVIHDHRRGTSHSEKLWLEDTAAVCGGGIYHIMNMVSRDNLTREIYVDGDVPGEDPFVPSGLIPYDSGSFFEKDGTVDLSMSGTFARSVASMEERI